MNYDQPLDSGLDQSQIGFSPVTREFLKTSALWARFLAIVGFFMAGLFILIAVFAASFLSSLDIPEFEAYSNSLAISVVYLFIAAIYFFSSLFMIQFANKTLRFTNYNPSQQVIENALKSLKNYFVFWGLTTAIIVGLYAMLIVAGIAGALYMGQ